MKKKIFVFLFFFLMVLSIKTYAESTIYTVKSGDTMWKIAVTYQVGLSEIIAANPQIKNPTSIYVGQKITIPTSDDVKLLENKVIEIVNRYRSSAGLAPLKANWEVSRVARMKSQDMINKNYFSHYSPTYGSPFKMMEAFGIKFSAAGENIAMGQRTPQEVMTSWMNSPGHRSNIMSSIYTQIGVGLAKNKNGTAYWTQMFIKPLR